MQKDISPEEKLLSIIKRKRDKPGDDGTAKTESDTGKAEAGAFSKKVDDLILAALKSSFLKNRIFDPGTLRGFNRYAVIIIAILASYLFLDALLARPYRDAASIISGASVAKAHIPIAEKALPIETKNYSYYSGKITGKNIFSAGSNAQADLTGSADAAGDTAAGNIGLVGIVPGNNPQAIIEDIKNQKTYYLIKGQSVNDISIEDINEGTVILEYRGKKMTLFL